MLVREKGLATKVLTAANRFAREEAVQRFRTASHPRATVDKS